MSVCKKRELEGFREREEKRKRGREKEERGERERGECSKKATFQ